MLVVPGLQTNSGAPVVVNGVQAGIASFTRRGTVDGQNVDLCSSQVPLVFVDVANPQVQAFIAIAMSASEIRS